MGEFPPPPPFFLSPLLSFFSYPSNIEIIFDFSYIITKFTPHFKILDPPLPHYDYVSSNSALRLASDKHSTLL